MLNFVPFIIPIGHDRLTVGRLPFATFGIIALNIAIFATTCSTMERDSERESRRLAELMSFYEAHFWVELPDEIVAGFRDSEQRRYERHREWIAWYATAPEEVESFLEGYPIPDSPEPLSREDEELRKAIFLTRIADLEPGEGTAHQRRADELAQRYLAARGESIARRFGYTPAEPSALGLVTGTFLHAGVFHLVFNMLFLWFAAVKLEDIWGKATFLVLYLAFGALATLAHHAADPESTTPVIGASGAVAGMMGAFLVRLTTTRIHFAYLFFIFLRPRYGTFEAPAWMMLPLWFAGELFSSFFFETGSVAYWAHVGGFAAGVLAAVAARLTDFETRVLGREPDEPELDPDGLPLVALQSTAETGSETAGGASSQPSAPALEIAEVSLEKIDSAGFHSRTTRGEELPITPGQVKAFAAARIDRLEPGPAERFFTSGTIPRPPALLIALLLAGRRPGPTRVLLLDESKLRYAELMSAPRPTSRESFLALVALLGRVFPRADSIGSGDQGPPALADLETFESRLRRLALNDPRRPPP
ncbi:MAG: rhomboid family intramembrane serine protease [Polyangia bacterium]